MNDLRMGVVGVGALGRHHARILSQTPGVELVAVSDLREQIVRDVAGKCGCDAVLDYRDLIDRVDAAVVAVPTHAHEDVACEFLQRRIPVLIEKPLARTFGEAHRIVELAEANGALVQVGHIERFNPATRTAWPLVNEPRYIRAERFSPFAFRSMDIGVVLDVMIHDVDLILDLVGSPVRRVDAMGMAILGRDEDCVQARLTFENGCIADLAANRVHTDFRRSLQAFCPDRVVSVDLHAREVACFSPTDRLKFGPSPIELASRPDADVPGLKDELFGSFIQVDRPAVPDADALTDELASFVDCVRRGTQPLVGGRAALAAMHVAHRILESIAADRSEATDAARRAA